MATIMVVDDYAITQRMLTYQLYKQGYQVVMASNEYEALDSLYQMDVDLLIVDLTTPKMDGLKILRQLRASSRYASLPIIMLTASGKEYDHKRALNTGVNAFLTRPASAWQLVSTVGTLLAPSQPVTLAA